MIKFKKWIIPGILIWFGLFSIFWATKIFGYDGFLLTGGVVVILVFTIIILKKILFDN